VDRYFQAQMGIEKEILWRMKNIKTEDIDENLLIFRQYLYTYKIMGSYRPI
jgi:hypothetical protein